MDLICSKPSYTKINISGESVPVYSFDLKSGIEIVATLNIQEQQNLQDILKIALAEDQNSNIMNSFVKQFIEVSAKYFAKKYSSDYILRLLTNELASESVKEGAQATEDSEVSFSPTRLIIQKTSFRLVWSAAFKKLLITIPDLEESVSSPPQPQPEPQQPPQQEELNQIRTVQLSAQDELQVVDDIMTDASQVETFSMRDSSRHYDKQRVKEAQLRARLAQYKAERAMTRYLEKYGDQVSDSEWEEDGDSEDEL